MKSVKTIFSFFFVFTAFIPIITIALFTRSILSKTINLEKDNYIMQVADHIAEDTNRWLRNVSNAIKNIDSMCFGYGFIQEKDLDSYLNYLLKIYPFFNSIFILDSDGVCIHSLPDKGAIGTNFSKENYYPAEKDKIIFTYVPEDPDNSSHRVIESYKSDRQAIILSMSTDSLFRILQRFTEK